MLAIPRTDPKIIVRPFTETIMTTLDSNADTAIEPHPRTDDGHARIITHGNERRPAMARSTSRKARDEWVRRSLESHKAQLKERETRTAGLYDALTAFGKTLDTARPLIQDFARDYGVPRSEIGEQFGFTPRQLSALFEPIDTAGGETESPETHAGDVTSQQHASDPQCGL